MGVRGEMFSTKVALDNRTYFFNVKENRNGDIFMTVVESKPSEGEGFDRHQIVLFADDTRAFLQGFEAALGFVDKELSRRRKAGREQRPAQERESRSTEGGDRGPRPTDAARGKRVLKKKAPGGARASYAGKPRREGQAPGAKPSQAGPQKPRAKVRSFKPKED